MNQSSVGLSRLLFVGRGAAKGIMLFAIALVATLSLAQAAAASPALEARSHPMLQGTTSCSGIVYRDDNANGSDDDGIALNAISMAIYDDSTGTLLGSAVTDGSGSWTISDLPIFTDVVVVVLGKSSLLKDAPLGADHDGLVQYVNTESCADLSTGLLLVSACTNLPLELGTFVWLDENADGIQNGDEAGLVGVTVNLYEDGTTNLVATTLTDADGSFLFTSDDGLEPNTDYDIRLDNPADVAPGGPLVDADDDPYSLTLANQGISEERDSDAAISSGSAHIDMTTGSLGTSHHFYDFGFVPPASIGDTVWIDHNGNDVRDTYSTANYSTDLLNLGGYDFSSMLSFTGTTALEEGIPNVTVELWNAIGDTLIMTTTTDANGEYLFRPVDPGFQYQVRVDDSTLPAGYVQTYDENGTGDHTSVAPLATTLTAGEQYRTADFGYGFTVDLAIDKSTDSDHFTGSPLNFTIVVTNNSAVEAPNVVVTDQLTPGEGPYGDPNYNVLFGRIWELWYEFTATGHVSGTGSIPDWTFGASMVVTDTVGMEKVASDWLNNNITIGGTDWTCKLAPVVNLLAGGASGYDEPIEYFQDSSASVFSNISYEDPPFSTSIDLNWACELNAPLAAGATAPPITMTVSDELNMFTQEFDYADRLTMWDTMTLYEWHYDEEIYAPTIYFHTTPVETYGNFASEGFGMVYTKGITNTAHVESRYGQEPLGLDADNRDVVEVSLKGDLEISKSLDTAGPYRTGDIVTYTVTVENVGAVPWYSDIHVADSPMWGGMLPVTSTLPTVDWTCVSNDRVIDSANGFEIDFNYRHTSSWSSYTRPEDGFACYHPPVAGGLQPGNSVSFTYQAYIGSASFVEGNSYVADNEFSNIAQLWGASANDDDPNNNWALVEGTFDLLPNAFTKGVYDDNINTVTFEIGMAGLTIGNLNAGQEVFVYERLDRNISFLSASNGWQCEPDPVGTTSSNTLDNNYVICYYDYEANGYNKPADDAVVIPNLLVTASIPLAWTGSNTACASIGYYLGYQSYVIGGTDETNSSSGNACAWVNYGGSAPGGSVAVDFAITKTHTTSPWAEGSTYTWTLTIDELGVGTDVPVVEDVMQPGATLVAVRNAGGDLLLDNTATLGVEVDGNGWDCTLDVAGGVGTLTPQEFSCIRDTAMLTSTTDTLFVEVLVGIDAGPEVTNGALVWAQTRPEPNKGSAIAHDDCWGGDADSGLADNCDTDTVPLSAVDFQISKTHDDSIIYYNGDPITSTIVITNNTAGLAPPDFYTQDATLPIMITDTLPSYSEFISYSGTGWSCSWTPPAETSDSSQVVCTYTEVDGLLQQGDTTEPLSFVWTRARFTSAKNTVQVTGSDRTIINAATPDLVDDTTPLLRIYPRVDKSASPTTIVAGESFTYTLGLKSQSTSSSYAPLPAPVRITDSIPAGFNVQSISGAEWDCSASSGQLVDCTFTGSGGTPTTLFTTTYSYVDVVILVDDDMDPGVVENTAYFDKAGRGVTSESLASDTVNVTIVEQVDLDISKSRDIAEPDSDDILDYTVVITNSASSSANDVVVTDLLPYGSSYVNNAGSDPAWNCSGDGNNPETVICSLNDTVPGNSNAPALHIHVQMTQEALPGILNYITIGTSSPTVSAPTGSLSATDEVILTTGCIGDYVWWDTLGDGVQEGVTAGVDGLFHTLDDVFGQLGPGADELLGTADDGQQGFQDVLMTLTDSNGGVITTTTDTAGYYSFGFLLEGSYTVTVDNNSGFLTYDNSPLSEFGPTYDLDSGTTNPDLVSRVSITDTGDITDLIALDVDFGFERLLGVSIGNRVWHDIDDDGSLDGMESGIDGVTVQLLNASGAVISTTTTTGGGFYTFTVDLNGDLLPEDDYRVRVPSSNFGTNQPLENYRSSSVDGGDPDNNTDSDDNGPGSTTGSDVTSDLVTVELESEPTSDGDDHNGNLTVDFGFFEPVTVGNRVWYDLNRNGEQDAGESGVSGIDVTLYNADTNAALTTDADGNTVTPMTTDGSGYYTFTNLPLGNYYVIFDTADIPTGYEITTQAASGIADANDSDADPTTGQTDGTGQLSSGDENLDLDMGIWAPASIGDTVWFDNDHDGIYEPSANENGVSGIEVTLYMSGNPTPLMTTTTDVNGTYLFTNLVPGDYYVDFDLTDLPTGYTVTREDVATDPTDEADSDTDPNTGETHVVTLAAGESNLSLDMGIYAKVSVGDRVWFDDDYDGMQDNSENGVSGIDVTLYDAINNTIVTADADGNTITPQTTDSNGYYLFSNLLPGNYYVVFDLADLPADYQVTKQDESGVGEANDSDADPITGQSRETGILLATDADMNLDMGIWTPVTIGDSVWYDNDGDGIQDAGEIGVPNVTVTLLDGTGTPLTDGSGNPVTAVTSATGFYEFSGLVPGSYAVAFDGTTLPAGYSPTAANAGSDDALDSDADPTTLTTPATAFLLGGESDMSLDLGIVAPVRVGDTVWYDDDRDGIQDNDEPGVENVTVNLLDGSGNPVLDSSGRPMTMATDATGFYEFANLPPGAYMVEFDLATLPSGYVPTAPNRGVDDATDSDASASTGRTAVTDSLAPGAEDMTLDMGIIQSGEVRIGDFVWEDLNANGLQDAGEPGVENVIVSLYQADGTPTGLTTITDGDGFYLFDEVEPGDYYVEFGLGALSTSYQVTTQNAGDDGLDSDVDPATNQTPATGFLDGGDEDLSLDLGIWALASLGDTVWLDEDADGVQESGEDGFANVTVNLLDGSGNPVLDGSGNPLTTVTDANGTYEFTNLMPGDYVVEFVTPAGYTLTQWDAGSNSESSDATDSDADPTTGRSPVVTLESGEHSPTIDAGVHAPTGIGNYIWEDLDGDGLQDSGEAGVGEVTVRLYAVDETGGDGTLVETTTTDANGFYGFNGLTPGDYYIEIVPLSNMVLTASDRGANDGIDSDADPTTGRMPVTTLESGELDLNWDAGLVRPASIGDTVWNDLDGDGLQDADEPGVENVAVHLYLDDVVETLIDTTLTDSNGNYEFTNVSPGDYILEFDPPPAYSITTPNVGSDNGLDSDVDPNTNRTPAMTLEAEQDDPTWDLGLVELARLGDMVWFDTNRNGIQDGGESGVAGITVNLLDAQSVPVTDESGSPITTVTDGSGFYEFTDLIPGSYQVHFDVPAAYRITTGDAGNDDAFDSDANAGGLTPMVTLGPGENNPTIDLGLFLPDSEPASIGDQVWYDVNENGIQDVGERGIPNVVVRLYGSDGTLISTQATDDDGAYLFNNLVLGDYYLEFDAPFGYRPTSANQGDEDRSDSDMNTNGRTDVTTLASDERDLTWDAGFVLENAPPASIGDTVWFDINMNGIQDDFEGGIPGVEVNLYRVDEKGNEIFVGTTTTGSEGRYLFEDLPSADYFVEFVAPKGYMPTSPNQGDDALDSDADPTSGRTSVTTLLPGENDISWDAGYNLGLSEDSGQANLPAMVGNYVWNDANENGIQDEGEPPMAGVVVELFTIDGERVATTITDENGNYRFPNLVPDVYYLQFQPPSNYTVSPPNAVQNREADSNIDAETGRTPALILQAGLPVLDLDAGFYLMRPTSLDEVDEPGSQLEPGIYIPFMAK